AVDQVPVVTLLERLLDAVAADALDGAGRAAAVPGREIAVVALLAGRHDAVAAAGDRAVRVAAVAVDVVAVVTLLAAFANAVAARVVEERVHRAGVELHGVVERRTDDDLRAERGERVPEVIIGDRRRLLERLEERARPGMEDVHRPGVLHLGVV